MATEFTTARVAPLPDRPAPPPEKSLGELFADLAKGSSTLGRQEVALAKAEVTKKAKNVGAHAGKIAIGGALAFAGLIVFLAAVTLILVQVFGMAAWAASLLVALITLGVGGFMAMNGLNAIKEADLTPHETIDTLKEDVQWTKEQVR